MVTTVSNWPSILLEPLEDLYVICFRIVHLRDKRREHFNHQWDSDSLQLKRIEEKFRAEETRGLTCAVK